MYVSVYAQLHCAQFINVLYKSIYIYIYSIDITDILNYYRQLEPKAWTAAFTGMTWRC